jgi:glycosyltransferase involved in cell wall biosynthesis
MVRRVIIDREQMENIEWQDIKPAADGRKERRRLLITTDNFPPRWDGISRFLSEMIPRLRESYEITVVAPDYGHVVIEGVEVVKIPLRKKSWGDYTPARFAYRQIKRLVRRSDIVFNQALGPIGLCAIWAAKRCRRPVASYIHSIEWELLPKALAGTLSPIRGLLLPFSKSVVSFFYNRCSVIILPSENIAELFSWQRIHTPKRIAHLGVDTVKFAPGDKAKARASLGLPWDAFIVGYHGRIAYEKNLLVLLRAFRRLNVKNKKLLIVGDGVPAIKERLLRSGDVIVTGSSNNVVPYLHAMDVYVQPSLTETTSLTVLEAMACGLPVVSSKVGFIKYYILDGENGLFFDNSSPYDLATKISRLQRDQVLRSTLSVNARHTVVEQFNWERTAEEIKKILDSI